MAVSLAERKRTLEGLCRTLREEQRHLSWYPDLLFQQIYNRVQWEETEFRAEADEARALYLRQGRAFLHQYRKPRLEQTYLGLTLGGHSWPVLTVDMSRDGTRVLSGDRGGGAVLWDAQSGRSIAVWQADLTKVTSCAISPDGLTLATVGGDKALRIWNLEKGHIGAANLRERMDHLSDVGRVRFSPDGSRVVSANYRTLKVWEVVSLKEIAAFREPGNPGDTVNDCAWSPDGAAIVSVGTDRIPRIWDAATGRQLRTLTPQAAEILCCDWSPDGTRIATGRIDRNVTIWDAVEGREIAVLAGHRHFVTGCAFSPDGRRLATSCLDHTLRLWDGFDGRDLGIFRGHSGGVRTLAWSGNGAALVSGGEDKTVRIWNPGEPRPTFSYAGHEGDVQDCQWAPNESNAVSAGYEGTLRIWDTAAAAEAAVLRPSGRPGREAGLVRVAACSFSPDGSRVVSATEEGTLALWASPSGEKISSWTLTPGSLGFFAWSPDGSSLAVAGTGGPAGRGEAAGFRICSAVDGSPIMSLDDAAPGILTCSFSPDGRRLLAVGDDQVLGIWDAASGCRLASRKPHDKPVNACYWSPDNRHIVTASEDRTLRIWDTGPSGSELAPVFTLEGHREGVGPCAYSPDGTRLVSGCADKTVRLWDSGSGRALAVMSGGEFPVARCGWSPDGRWVASSTIFGGLRIWDGRTGAAAASLEAERAGRVTFLWSPEGGRIFHAGPENALQAWDVVRNRRFAVYYADAEISSFGLSPDGRGVIVGDVSGGILLLRLEDGTRAGNEVS